MKRPLAVLICSLLMSSAGVAAPAIWKVSDADSAIWLFGSVHLLRPDANWRTAKLDKLISKVDRVYFEADISPAGQAEILPLTAEMGFNRDGKLLSDLIGEDLTERVREAAARYDLPMAALLAMKPWLAATTLSTGPLAQSGFDAALGVETILGQTIAPERTGFLETGAEQLGFLAGGTIDEQIAMLEATLDTLDSARADLDTMVDAWLDGEPEALGVAFDTQMAGFGDALVDRIIDIRNADWVDKIEVMLKTNETTLLVVGAAHLAGDASVLTLLENRGFRSERIQ